MNYIKQISRELLGIEWDRKHHRSKNFNVKIQENLIECNIRENGKIYKLLEKNKFDSKMKYEICKNITLIKLLNGTIDYENFPKYATPIFCHEGDKYQYVMHDSKVVFRIFECSTFDYCLRDMKNCFSQDEVIPEDQIAEIVQKMTRDCV